MDGSIGQQLKLARAAMGITPSEVARATNMKVQIVDALESDDFSSMAAPAYAKGFIRLYAEHVGLDPKPLIDAYLSQHSTEERPPLVPESSERSAGEAAQRAAKRMYTNLKGIPRERVARVVLSVGIALAVALVITGTIRLFSSSEHVKAAKEKQAKDVPSKILEEPPDPYLDVVDNRP
jgi:cytoskeletal protein RodZ